jgi:ribosomal protein S18 acetylase RimI-like enzyme
MSESGVILGASPMFLRLATVSDLPALARIHKQTYSRKHFTALLSNETLEKYYAFFLAERSEILLAVRRESSGAEMPLGFAVYGRGIPERIKRFKHEASKDILMTSLRHPVLAIQKVAGVLRSKLSGRKVYAPADFLLLSIAVSQKSCGIGGMLLKAMLAAAQEINTKTMGLYVNVDNLGAINAYYAAGFRMRNYSNRQYYMEVSLK